MNLILRSVVWIAALAWFLYLRMPAGSTLFDIRPGIPRLIGATLVVAGLSVYLWAARELARGAPAALAASSVLLSRGPYQYVRNPLYLAAAAVFSGSSTLSVPWARRDVLTGLVVAALVHVLVVWKEEPATRRRLGSAYDGYCASVPRWIPTMWLRHLLSIAILPFTVTVLIPLSIARQYPVERASGSDASMVALQTAGAVLLSIGLAFFVASLRRFATEGHGTLAPWDPPVDLVVRGPYRYVRNPMISGVVLVLFGESLVLLSLPHAAWAAGFLVINLIYIPLFEEPQLAGRFGAAYLEYCRHVPRILPRLRPWVQSR